MKGLERFVGDLGNECFGSRRKEWIVSALSAAGGLAASLFGGGAASRAQKEGIEAMKKANNEQNALLQKRIYQDYVDTNYGQNLVRKAKQFNLENWRRAQGAKAVGAGTDAATQMTKDAGNKMMGETLSNIAASEQRSKEHALDKQMDLIRQNAAMEQQVASNRAQQITNATQAASNAMMGIGSAIEQGVKDGWRLTGGSNSSQTQDSSTDDEEEDA